MFLLLRYLSFFFLWSFKGHTFVLEVCSKFFLRHRLLLGFGGKKRIDLLICFSLKDGNCLSIPQKIIWLLNLLSGCRLRNNFVGVLIRLLRNFLLFPFLLDGLPCRSLYFSSFGEYFLLKEVLFSIEGEESFLFLLKLHKPKNNEISCLRGFNVVGLHIVRLGIIGIIAVSLPKSIVNSGHPLALQIYTKNSVHQSEHPAQKSQNHQQ